MYQFQGEENKKMSQSRPPLLRRGPGIGTGGSFKRRSLKLRRGTKEGKEMEAESKYSVFTNIQLIFEM